MENCKMKEVDDIVEVQSFYEMMLDQHGEACKLYNFKKDWAFRLWCDYFHELEKHLNGQAMERFIFCSMCKVQCKKRDVHYCQKCEWRIVDFILDC